MLAALFMGSAGCVPVANDPSAIQERDREAYGYRVPDKTSEIEPSKILPPEEFMVDLENGERMYKIPANIEKIAKDRGWPLIKYKTRSSGGFDGTPSLVLVVILGKTFTPPLNYDRYLQFSLARDPEELNSTPIPQAPYPSSADYAANDNTIPAIFDLIAVERNPHGKSDKIGFRLFTRSRYKKASELHSAGEPQDPTFCAGCHPNGPRPISPLGYRTFPGEAELPEEVKKTITEVNDSLSSYNFTEWPGMLRVSMRDLGPGLGEVDPASTITREEIIGRNDRPGCANRPLTIDYTSKQGQSVNQRLGSQSIRWQKVRDAMNCKNCHGTVRSILPAYLGRDEVKFKILGERSMPPGADDLTMPERAALVQCLYEHENQQFQPWVEKLRKQELAR